MSKNEPDQTDRKSDDARIEEEILSHRKFSLAEAIGRLGGGDLMKGASPVTQRRQAELVLEAYLEQNLSDSEGALEIILKRHVSDSDILLEIGFENPMAALAVYLDRILSSEELLRRFVDAIDREWGRMYRERPYFERPGQPPDRDDPYTITRVRDKLERLREELRDA